MLVKEARRILSKIGCEIHLVCKRFFFFSSSLIGPQFQACETQRDLWWGTKRDDAGIAGVQSFLA